MIGVYECVNMYTCSHFNGLLAAAVGVLHGHST